MESTTEIIISRLKNIGPALDLIVKHWETKNKLDRIKGIIYSFPTKIFLKGDHWSVAIGLLISGERKITCLSRILFNGQLLSDVFPNRIVHCPDNKEVLFQYHNLKSSLRNI